MTHIRRTIPGHDVVPAVEAVRFAASGTRGLLSCDWRGDHSNRGTKAQILLLTDVTERERRWSAYVAAWRVVDAVIDGRQGL